MFKQLPLIETPPDDTILWRYMTLSNFLFLLASRKLYFCHKYELDDPWEGEHSATFRASFSKHLDEVLGGKNDAQSELHRRFIFGVVDLVGMMATINCWHEDDSESVAMWSLYAKGSDGVAISTTVGDLKKALNRSKKEFYIGRVSYETYAQADRALRLSVDSPESYLLPLFQKRKSFQHEREVRAVIVQERKGHSTLDLLRSMDSTRSGLQVPVDVSLLCKRVVAAPTYPKWGIRALQSIVSDSALAVKVETSDLLKKPSRGKHRRLSRREQELLAARLSANEPKEKVR